MERIFLVEDDPVIAGAVSSHLAAWGYQVVRAADFQAVLAEFAACDPQLVLLDLSLPFFNGYHWCREIRAVSKAPIVFLSSAGDNMNIVTAMQLGADDFIVKPFDLAVLTAKIQAILRRSYDFSGQTGLLSVGGAVLNTADATLTNGKMRAELTKNEFRILEELARQKGKVVSREALMRRLWETDSFVDDNTLTVNVTRLRKKLDDIGLSGLIQTKKGLGYLVE